MKRFARAYPRAPRSTAAATLLIAAALLAGCGSSSSGTTTTQSKSSSHHLHLEGLVALAAGYLGVEREKVRQELREGKTFSEIADATPGHSSNGLLEFAVRARREELESREREGHLTQQQVTERIETIRTRISARLSRQGYAVRGVAYAATIRYLGISAAQLRADRRAGKSLAEIASDTPGRSEHGLVEAIVDAETRALSRTASSTSHAPSRGQLEAAAQRFVKAPPVKSSAAHRSGGEAAKEGGAEAEAAEAAAAARAGG
jgi:hypothetical protein